MQVTHKIKVLLDDNRMVQPIEVMQDDAYTRKIEFSLYAEGKEWPVPDGASVAVAYSGNSGHGIYDTLTDGSKAYTAAGNIVSVTLIPQVTAMHGRSTVTVVFTDSAGKQLAAFGVEIRVAPNPAAGAGKPANYYNLREWVSTPMHVDIFKIASGGYATDKSYYTILKEYEAGKQIICRVETEDQQWLMLPLVTESAGALEFGCICGDCYWQAVITQAEDGAAAVAVAIKSKADAPAATDEIYFDITAEGVISLKPEYRGACPSAAANNEANRVKYAYAISDNDVDLPGTQNKELPEEIVIPDTVGGIAVTALAYGMFMCNRSIKRLVLPAGIKEIPSFFCFEAVNLTEVAGTEGVEILNSNAFKKSGLRKAHFPDLLTLTGNAQFENCTNLAVANLGHVFENHGATIPKACFSLCEKLERLENAQGVGVIGENGMYGTYRISGLPFLAHLAEIGNRGLYLSRADCDWENSIVGSYGEAATSHQLNTYAYTESNKVRVACSTPMRSTFEQHDPRWADKPIGQANRVYSSGCMTVCAAMVYSALMGVELESPEGFVEAVGKANPELLKVDIADGVIGTDPNGEKDTDFTELRQWLDAVGLHGEFCADASDENVKAMYTALAGKALVIARVAGGYAKSTGYGVHNVVFRGINANGELLVVDPSSAGRALGIYEAAVYAKPIQCMMRDENGAAATGDTLADGFVIVTKK